LKLFELRAYLFIQLIRDQDVENGKQNSVLFLNVTPDSFRKPLFKKDKLGRRIEQRYSSNGCGEMNMADEVKKDNRLLPPVYFLFALILMVVLHFFLPFVHWFWWPWNLVGIAPILLGIALNMVADTQFKRHKTTVKPFQPSSVLITDGVFRVSRNPMYLGMVCILIGIGICLASLTPLVVIPLFVWWITARFIVPEEQALAEQFGHAYAAFKTEVRRWV
jgi:protein-S-isoprenylcysteine O-methyltransferase Ste14